MKNVSQDLWLPLLKFCVPRIHKSCISRMDGRVGPIIFTGSLFFSVFHSIIFNEVESIYCALYKMYKRIGIKSNWFFFWPLMNLVKI